MGAMKAVSVIFLVCFLGVLANCSQNRKLVGNKAKAKAKAKAQLGGELITAGKTGSGLRHLLEALEMDPENPDIHHELALGYRNLRKDERAFYHFNRALTLRPIFPEALNNLGTLCLITGQWDRAIEAFQKALNITTYRTPHFAYNNIGLAFFKKKEYEKAVENYRKALSHFNAYPACHRNLAMVYDVLDRHEQAVHAYKRAISYAPDEPGAYLELGRLYLKLGRIDEAREALKKTIALDPHGPYGDEASRYLKRISKMRLSDK